jgi:iron-sulfur cluster assembly protein
MIKVSDLAKKSISIDERRRLQPRNRLYKSWRKSGGCSGLEYVLKFDNEKTEADQVFEDNGVKLL